MALIDAVGALIVAYLAFLYLFKLAIIWSRKQ